MTLPYRSRTGDLFNPPPPAAPQLPEDTAHELLDAVRRLRRRHAGRLLTAYLLLSAVVAAAPAALRHRVVGHLSLALLLLIGQLAVIVWTLAGHRRGADTLDEDLQGLRSNLPAHDPWGML